MSVCGRGSVSVSDLEHAYVCFGTEGGGQKPGDGEGEIREGQGKRTRSHSGLTGRR